MSMSEIVMKITTKLWHYVCQQIRRDVNACVCLTMQEDETLDLVVLASRLSSYGYIPVLRTAPGGGHGVDCFKNLHHSFICLHKEAEDDGRHIFVDPNFKYASIHPVSYTWDCHSFLMADQWLTI